MILVQLAKGFQKMVAAAFSQMLFWFGDNKKVKTKGRANVGSANNSFKPTALRASA
jgi:hypothetical protein